MTDLFLERDAVISECGRYRYLLRRVWDHRKPRALFIMLNPSTADAEVDDATVRSCIRLCHSWRYGSFEVINLFAWRATDPMDLPDNDDKIGPQRDGIAEAAICRCDIPIAAWGAHPAAEEQRQDMIDLIKRHRPALMCLGRTKVGAPKHPLYIPTGTQLEVYQ